MLEALEAVTRAAGLAPEEEGFAGLKAQLEIGIGAPERATPDARDGACTHSDVDPLRFELASLLEYQLREPAARPRRRTSRSCRLDPAHGATLSQLTFLRGRLADWRDRARSRAAATATRSAAGVSTLSPFAFLSLPSTRAEQRACAARVDRAARRVGAGATARFGRRTRLRIGYLSADFHSHATAFLAAGLFESHDRSRFEIVAYSTGPDDRSPMRARLTKAFDRFVDVRDRNPIERRGHHPQRRRRHPRRPEGTHAGRDAHRARAAAGADPGPLPRLSRHARGRARRLPHRRCDRHARRALRATMRKRSPCCPAPYQVNDRQRPIGDDAVARRARPSRERRSSS